MAVRDPQDADDGTGPALSPGQRVAKAIKAPLALVVSGLEHLRIWLLTRQWFSSVLLPAMPRQLRWFLRRVYLAPIDVADRLLGRHNADLPSKAGTFTGAVHDFAASGEALVNALRDVAGMTTSSHVLDIGCGVGRLAIPSSRFLGPDGSYEGIDIVPDGIAWCKQHISSPHDNVHFTLADVYNKEYNPKGRVQAADYRFPYEDETFDVVVLVSVFTHMLPAEVERYVSEIARVMKKNGRMFATYSLITPESLQLMDSPASAMRFKHHRGSHWVISERVPELAVAYDEPYIREVYAKSGFADPPDVYVGAWCGRTGYWPLDSGLGDQDTLVATKL
jgi:SAM-dependent methyltransferase